MKKVTLSFITFLLLLCFITTIEGQRRPVKDVKVNKSRLNLQKHNRGQMKTMSAEPVTQEVLDNKCAACQEYLEKKQMNKYNSENCRALKTYCVSVDAKGGTGPIVVEEDDTLDFQPQPSDEYAFKSNGKNEIVVFLNGSNRSYNNLVAVVEVFDRKNKRLFSSKGKPIQTYTFNKKNKLIAVRGVNKLRKVSKNQQHALVVPVKLGKIASKQALVKVSLKKLNPKTRKYKTVKVLQKRVRVR